MYRYLIVWYVPFTKKYYFRILKHNYNNYCVGYINDYNHVCVIYEDISSYLYVTKNYFNLKRKIIKLLISFLNKV